MGTGHTRDRAIRKEPTNQPNIQTKNLMAQDTLETGGAFRREKNKRHRTH